MEPKLVGESKIPYRPVTVTLLASLIDKYRTLPSFEHASKLLVEEELLILKKEPHVPIKDTVVT